MPQLGLINFDLEILHTFKRMKSIQAIISLIRLVQYIGFFATAADCWYLNDIFWVSK